MVFGDLARAVKRKPSGRAVVGSQSLTKRSRKCRKPKEHSIGSKVKKSRSKKNNSRIVKNCSVKNGAKDKKMDAYSTFVSNLALLSKKKIKEKTTARESSKLKKSLKLCLPCVLGIMASPLAFNQCIRLSWLYEIADQGENMQNGKGCSSVEEYKYRGKGDENRGDKELIMKKINYLSPGIFAFSSEKMAKDFLSNLKKDKGNDGNEVLNHFTNVIDYHYGLTSGYVVYEKANKHDRWKEELNGGRLVLKLSKENKAKILDFLADVFTQVLDCSEFLVSKGLLHGDLDFHNYNIDKVNKRPYVRVFDYGMLHRIKKNPFFWQSFNAELEKIVRGFIVLYCYYLDIVKVDLNDKDVVFELVDKIRKGKIGSGDENLQSLVRMYSEIQGAFVFSWWWRGGKRPLCIKGEKIFGEDQFKNEVTKLRGIIDQMKI